jgi:hypothetical protein
MWTSDSRSRRIAFSVIAVVLTVLLTIGDFGWIDLTNGFSGLCRFAGTCSPAPASDWVLSGGYGTIAGIIIPVGILAQLRTPGRQIAALLQVALAALAFLLVGLLGADQATVVFAAILVISVGLLWTLHPHPCAFLRWRPHLSLSLLVLALAASGPLCVYTWHMAANQRSEIPEAAEAIRSGMGGWIGNGAMALGILFVALLVALRPTGWRVSAWSAGLAAFIFGVDSLLSPSLPGSAGTGWGTSAGAWGLFFIGVAEWVYRRSPPLPCSP